MKHMRLLSVLLAMALCLGLLSGTVLAAPEDAAQAAEVRLWQSRNQNFVSGTWTGADNQKMLQIARAQKGKYGRELNYTEDWCADFISDISDVAGVEKSVIPWGQPYTSGYVPAFYQAMLYLGAEPVAIEDARVGDIMFFCWSRTDRNGPVAPYMMDHVAMAVYYDAATNCISYIGGNQGKVSGYSNRQVTEVLLDVEERGAQIAAILRPKYKNYDPTPPAEHLVSVRIAIQGEGAVEGETACMPGSQTTLTAVPAEGSKFLGWYDYDGSFLYGEPRMTIQVTGNHALTAKFVHAVNISAYASRSGSVAGSGTYFQGEPVTLTASGRFSGWYDAWGNLKSTSPSYTFSAEADTALWALFQGDVFVDIPADAWYLEEAMEAHRRGLIKGMTDVTFDAAGTLTRGMATVILHRFAGSPAHSCDGSFSDVPAEQWFYDAAEWAHETGLYEGTGTFAPYEPIPRQEYFEMAVKLLNLNGCRTEPAELPFIDVAHPTDLLRQAYAFGVLRGDGDGRMRPESPLSRAEGAAIVLRLYHIMVQPEPPVQPDDPAQPEPVQPETPVQTETEPQEPAYSPEA